MENSCFGNSKVPVLDTQNQTGRMIFDCEKVVCGQVESPIKSLIMIIFSVIRKSKMLRLVNLVFVICSVAPPNSYYSVTLGLHN